MRIDRYVHDERPTWGAAGVLLYGTSLLAGLLGSAHLPTMARELIAFDVPAKLADGQLSVMVLALGGLMLGVGLAFKLSAVPFHFWCPDRGKAPGYVAHKFNS